MERLQQTWRNQSDDNDDGTNYTPLYVIMAINACVFVLWQAEYSASMQNWLLQNFTVSLRNMAAGRYWTLLTGGFSQEGLLHLGVNMFVLYSFGHYVFEALGSRQFLALYLGSAIASSICHLMYMRYALPRIHRVPPHLHQPWTRLYDRPSHGASGAVATVVTLAALMNPAQKVLLYFVIPVPVLAAVGMFVVYDAYQAIQGRMDGVAHAAHLGGSAIGFLYFMAFRRRLPRLRF